MRERDPDERGENGQPTGAVRHVLCVASQRADGGAVESIATRLAEAHGAELTLVYALSPLRSPLATGGEAFAQREELKGAVRTLRRRVAIARRCDVPAHPEVREGSRAAAVGEVLEEGAGADLVVAPVGRSDRWWNVFAGRGLERIVRSASPPVLGVHRADRLRLDSVLRVAVVHWTCEGGLAAAERVRALFTLRHGPPSIAPVRVLARDGRAREDGAAGRDAGGTTLTDPIDAHCAEIRALEPDVVALAGDASPAGWPRRSPLGRIAPRLDRPVLAL